MTDSRKCPTLQHCSKHRQKLDLEFLPDGMKFHIQKPRKTVVEEEEESFIPLQKSWLRLEQLLPE